MSVNPTLASNQDQLTSLRAWEILEKVPEPRYQGYAAIAAQLVGAPYALIAIQGRDQYRIVAGVGLIARDVRPNAFCALAMQADGTIVIDDAQIDLRVSTDPLVSGVSGVRFCAALPLLGHDGEVTGALCVFDRRPRSITPDEQGRLADLAGALSATMQLRHDVTALCEAALHDPVTGLNNRSAFECQLDAAIDEAGRIDTLGLICVNTDKLQSVNQMFGHAAGDHLLRVVAQRAVSAAPNAISIARIGTDEFAVLFSGVSDSAQVATLTDEIIAAIATPITLGGQQIEIQGAAGFALYPDDGDSPSVLLDRAKATLQKAKSEGQLVGRRFEPAIEREDTERVALEADLKTAIEGDQMFLYWQPIADALTRQPVGYEALLRWERPGHGLVPPGQFIAAAETCGLSGQLDAMVLRKACCEAAKWPDKSLRASVNVSSNRVRFGDLSDSVADALKASGLVPARLEIEITERVLMEDELAVRAALEALRALGVRIALDDFGTGFSSLSYLRSLPLDKLKLDRSFTRDLVGDPQARELARTVVKLGRVLGLIVLAEGVESEDQLSCLRVLGCDEVQGYLLGWPRPMPVDAAGGDRPQRSGLALALH